MATLKRDRHYSWRPVRMASASAFSDFPQSTISPLGTRTSSCSVSEMGAKSSMRPASRVRSDSATSLAVLLAFVFAIPTAVLRVFVRRAESSSSCSLLKEDLDGIGDPLHRMLSRVAS